jgi:hypothetical protein
MRSQRDFLSGLTVLIFTGVLLLVFAIGAPSGWADTLTLKDGQVIQGLLVERSETAVKFKVGGVGGQELNFPMSAVQNISFGAPPAPESPAAPPPAPAPAAAGNVTVSAGMPMVVKLQDTIDSRKHKANHKFTAALEGDLVSGGVVVAPKGSTVYGVITSAKRSGRLRGQTELVLTLTEINVNDQLKPIVTSKIKASGGKTGKQTVGRAARGAAVGGLVDGSDGAETGAKIALGLSIVGGGGDISIPQGTLLEFRLEAPFTP